MKPKQTITALISCVVTLSATAQTAYTLEQCKELSLKNNIQAKNSQLNVTIAEEAKKETFTHYFPSVSAMGTGFKTSNPIIDMDMDLSPLLGEMPPIGVYALEDGIIGSVMATQPIFAGGQIVNGNKLAKLGVEVSQYQKKISDNEILLKTEELYWQLCALMEKVKTVAEIEILLNSVHKDVKISYEAGLITKNDLLKVELKQNELASGKLKLESGVKLLKMALGQHIGISPDAFDIKNSVSEEIPLPYENQIDPEDALLQRTEYRLLDKSVEAGHLQKKMEIGKNLPTVAIGAGYNYYGFDKSNLENSFGMVFATVSIPISGWWSSSHAIKKQNLNILIAENNKQNASEMLLLQMQQIWDELVEAYRQMALFEQSIDIATENVRLNGDYYKAGTGILTDLLNAQSALQQSCDQYTEAVMGYRIKLSKYLQVTGQ
ncbi:MAG: TolC family protein [Mediterranea sp.]|jgi:outer membrane protein TolC|nr:TolC family protein [Mediterranea sp.]